MVSASTVGQMLPWAAVLTAALLSVLAVSLHFRDRLKRVSGIAVGILLVGYAFLHRSFAYLGAPPLFIGELVLLLLVLTVALAGSPATVLRSRPARALLVFQAVGLVATVPYLAAYGVDALRDAVLWGYGVFAIAIAALATDKSVHKAMEVYGRLVPWFLALMPVMIVAGRLVPGLTSAVTFQGIPVFDPKSGDIAVHLAGVAAFLALGLHRQARTGVRSSAVYEWVLWGLWLVTFALISDNRGGMVAVLAAMMVLIILARGSTRFWKPLALAVCLVGLAAAWQVEIGGEDRVVSVNAIFHRISSAFVNTGEEGVDGTKEWRIDWWTDIVGYTVNGPYRWLGKGYGVNLADDDGYQVQADGSLRSPHNGHMTVLARSGMLGLAAWVLFLVALLLPLARVATSQGIASRLPALWLLIYLLAALVNATFDVYLEGPQGGIWFWVLAGAAMTLLRSSRPPRSISADRT